MALTRALELSKGQRVNIYTDSKYAYLTLHAHAAIWKERQFKTATGEPIKHFREIERFLTANPKELTSYLTQLSAFQQESTELQETTSDPVSESSKHLFEPGTEVLIKTLGSGGSSLEPLWEGPYQDILSSPTAVKVPGIDSWVDHTRVKRWHPDQKLSMPFYVFTFYALTLYFSDGPDNLCEPTSADSRNPESAI